MRKHNSSEGRYVVGLDLSDRTSQVCVLDVSGSVVEESKLRLTPEAHTERFAGCRPMRIALEAGTHSPWVSQLLRELGHDVIVADPRQLPLIFKSRKKNDPVDAENLARLARVDPKLLHPIEHRGEQARTHLSEVRSREILVKTRTKLINHVRGVVKSFGGRVPKCSTPCFHKKAAEVIPESLQAALLPVIELIGETTNRIRSADKRIEKLCEEEYPVTQLLRAVGGVGALTALSFVLILEDPRRFTTSRAVGPYVGLVPRQCTSGDSKPQLGISKAGDKFLRGLLVGAAQYILGPFGTDCDLREWGLRIWNEGGKNAKKRAATAVARKLAVLLHHLWVTGEVYDPFHKQRKASLPRAG